jgi:C_GCAxxG_C_C family probable redox protein
MGDGEDASRRAFDLGFRYEQERMGCPQCVLAAIQDTLGIVSDDVFKSASAFAGGLADSTNGTCGALVGGVMAIGCRYGRGREDFDASDYTPMRRCMELADELLRRFVDEFGSLTCRGVQEKIFGRSFNVKDPREREEFERAGGHKDKCPTVVGKVARWAVEILMGHEGS